ncbi:ATP-binding protein [Dyadobacter frigoris]|uniref:ATP-binding protein n=1 Tax=Dyadobacter frigoris TaxID=2576211 RepID=A0A4U6DAW3_9BACT|nr:ATP-binding protein [Dyadobacter frigoris]TKT93338.1 ATP-binding protein [Dyadobacter frigoris]
MTITDSTQDYTYSPSVNIIRDKDKEIRYIPTYNGQRAFEQIISMSGIGTRSFSIVGAYGSGKSAFLWALAEAINKNKPYFEGWNYLLKSYSKNEIIDFIGDFSSVIDSFARELKCEKENVIAALHAHAEDLKNKNTALLIRIDEFGKFLEHAAKSNPEGEFYFLQQLAEMVNNPQGNIILITTLHQDFAAYAYHLNDRQRNEWAKVKGRFKEITFNEPTEQLLLLVANRLQELRYPVDNTLIVELLHVLDIAKLFPLKDYFNLDTARKLTPLDILAGSSLVIALQRYGQNERSVFSFIESKDFKGLHQYIEAPDAPMYNLAHVYNYITYHYYNQITVKDNPDYRVWRLMRDNIERAEGLFDDQLLLEATQLIKTIGLLNLFGKTSSKVNKDFLIGYGRLVQNQKDTAETLRLLEQHKIIRFREHSNRYVLFEGTDVDIEYAINAAGELVGHVSQISQYLNEYFKFPIIPAKRYQVEIGTPRFFEIKISDSPIAVSPAGERDGFINLVFSSTHTEEQIRTYSANVDDAIIYVYFKHNQLIREQVTEIEKIKQARQKYGDDKTARFEFDHILLHQQNLLRHYVLDKFYAADQNEVSFYHRGIKVNTIHNRRSLNNFLSDISITTYQGTPVFLNEMVNKTKLGGSIVTARKSLLNRLVENSNEYDLGFSPNLFPPEKTIYLSLIKEKGFHQKVDGIWQLTEPTDLSLAGIWDCFNKFLTDAKHSKLSLQELSDRLLERPIKVKKGFVDFFLPIALLVRQSDFSLFNNDVFIPKLNANILDLIIKKPSDYSIKSFSASGINLSVFNKYRALLNQKEISKHTNVGFIETIRPFLSFYQNLPTYSKNTNKLSKEALGLRKAIQNSSDPEKTFFEDFPQAFGYSLVDLDQNAEKLERYFLDLSHGITEIRTTYPNLLTRYETFIFEEIIGNQTLPFEEWKNNFQQRFKNIKGYLVAPHLKVFLQRIHSKIEEKNTWLSSLAHAILGKQLDEINDEDELILFRRFKDWIHELDNYVDLQDKPSSENLQNSLKIEITSLESGTLKQTLTFPKSKEKEVASIEKKIVKFLTTDKNLNVFILTKILNEQLR